MLNYNTLNSIDPTKKNDGFAQRYLFSRYAFIVLVSVVLAVVFVAYSVTYSDSLQRLNEFSLQRMSLYTSQLKEKFGQKQRYAVDLVKKSRELGLYLSQATPQHRENMQYLLKNVSDPSLGEYVVWLNGEDILFGQDVDHATQQALRPSLARLRHQAYQGRGGLTFSVAGDTGQPFYMFASPFGDPDGEGVRGAVVVLVDLALIQTRIADNWSMSSEVVFVGDAYGLIVLSSRESWLYKAINKLPYSVKKRLNENGRLVDDEHSLGVAQIDAKSGLVKMLNISRSDDVPAQSFLANSTLLPEFQLRVHHLVDTSDAHRNALVYAVGLASVAGIAVLLLLYVNANRLSKKLAAEREQILAKSEAHKSNIINATDSGLISFYTDGTVESVNSASRTLLNLMPDAEMTHLNQLFVDEYLIHQLTHVEQYLGEFREREVVACRPDGSQFSAQISVNSMHTDAPALWLMTLLDITEQKKNEDERRKNQKMIAMGMMSATVAHEINQPLTAIKTEAAIALKLLQKNKLDQLTQGLQSIGDFATSIATITSQLRSFSRMHKTKNDASAQIYSVVQAVHVLFKSRLERENIRWQESLSDFDLQLKISRNELQQILTNLVQNACDAMANSATKTLRIEVEVQRSNALVTVSDTGCGIDAKHLDRVFEPFVSTKNDHEGLGLGLAICADIVSRVGGNIDLESGPNGTAFILTLPIQPAADMQQVFEEST